MLQLKTILSGGQLILLQGVKKKPARNLSQPLNNLNQWALF